jgi:glycerol-3-phosphate O-acyltransferase / dihydroxyacetone phosphate acyltransferase
MLYQALRSAARVALRWYYSDVIVQGRERIPARGPVLIVANHPNALVDALLIATAVDRRVLLTAKATLFEHPFLAPLLGIIGVVPLRRAKDEHGTPGDRAAVSRNADAFRMVTDALRRASVVLVFPEGISHDEPSLAPLRSGAARMAMMARDTGARALHVLPIGLVYEEKERPRSQVLVRIGAPIDLDAWYATNSPADATVLILEMDTRLRQLTLNFPTAERAVRAVRMAQALAALAGEPPPLGEGTAFVSEAQIASRVGAAIEALEYASPALVCAVDAFTAQLAELEARLAARGVALSDARISIQTLDGTRFVLRETALSLFALPIAAVGRMTHWLPIRAARALALRTLASNTSRDQPAMRTIVFGMAALLVWYGVWAVLLTRWLSGVLAVICLFTAFVAAQVDLALEDRLTHVWKRVRTYRVLRGDRALRTSALEEIDALLEQAIALEKALIHSEGL